VADPPAAPWKLLCPWCAFYIVVNARGARGNDPGSGVEAAQLMAAHVAATHGRTWSQALEARC
jgi:hypothetical protein